MLDQENPFKDKLWTEHVADFLSMGYELDDAMKLADEVHESPPGDGGGRSPSDLGNQPYRNSGRVIASAKPTAPAISRRTG